MNAKLKSNRTGRRQPGLPSDDLRHFLRHRRPLLAHAARDAQQEDAGVGGGDREIRQDAQQEGQCSGVSDLGVLKEQG